MGTLDTLSADALVLHRLAVYWMAIFRFAIWLPITLLEMCEKKSLKIKTQNFNNPRQYFKFFRTVKKKIEDEFLKLEEFGSEFETH